MRRLLKTSAVASIATFVMLVGATVLALASFASFSGRAEAQTSNASTTATRSTASAPRVETSPMSAPQIGQSAPDFRLPYATQERIFMQPAEQMALSSLRGRNVVLAFYPADWSGGCTAEVCALRDTFAELSRLNATVLGISGDYVFSHQEWAKHHNLQFPLLSDHDHRVARMYASFNEANGFNRRTIYLIDRNGVVRYTNMNFRANEQADYERLRAELARLQ